MSTQVSSYVLNLNLNSSSKNQNLNLTPPLYTAITTKRSTHSREQHSICSHSCLSTQKIINSLVSLVSQNTAHNLLAVESLLFPLKLES